MKERLQEYSQQSSTSTKGHITMIVRKIELMKLNNQNLDNGGGGIHPYHEILSIIDGTVRLHWMGNVYVAAAPAIFLLPANTPHLLLLHSERCIFGYIELEADKQHAFPGLKDAGVWNELEAAGTAEGAAWPAEATEAAKPVQHTVPRQAAKPSKHVVPEQAAKPPKHTTGNSAKPPGAMLPTAAIAVAHRHSPGIDAIRQANAQIWESLAIGDPYQTIADQLVVHDIRKLLLLIGQYLRHQELGDQAHLQAGQLRTETHERLQAVMRLMESRYQKPVTIRELAAAAGLEKSHFIRTFHKLYGKTPLQYLHELRLSAACCYLATTEMAVQEIAEASGFQSIHYFSRLFKQHYGISPINWRKEQGRG